ncbi:hypothetical protein [Kutzneria kofuensis]|uniref:hypothetical protein n=1 Tax=Kutzneria kofuensis TaxID=103725 RepID=UPI0031EF2D5C
MAKTSVHDVPNEPPSASFGDMLSDASGVSLFTGGGYLNKVQDWSEKANATSRRTPATPTPARITSPTCRRSTATRADRARTSPWPGAARAR